ncbi:MAG: PLP-dependent transferase, partial [Bacillota bacterium]|nr:PLP-dependent transferase [Bacillota bacterium]
SKVINGSGNSIGGIIVDKGKFPWSEEKFPKLFQLKKKYGPFAYLAKLRQGLHRDVGACMAPFNAYLNSLGLETLGLRLDRICDNALALAKSLQNHPNIKWINYPGLNNSPYKNLATQLFGNKYGIIFTFGVGSKQSAFQVINNLKYPCNLANIGDIRTLVIHPSSTIYAANSANEKASMGVLADMIRVSVGIEDIKDLIADFNQALDKITN